MALEIENPSESLEGYLPAFSKPEEMFVTYYAIGEDKSLVPTSLTRGEFFLRAQKGASMLASLGVGKGDRFVLYFTDNRLEDLVLRFSSVLVGAIPVTVNWQADTGARVVYKASESRV